MMKSMARLALVLASVAAAACAPAQGPAAGAEPEAFSRGVEVNNTLNEPVDVSYTLPGSDARQFLGTVSGGSRARFVLPDQPVATVTARRADGGPLPSRTAVQITRVRL